MPTTRGMGLLRFVARVERSEMRVGVAASLHPDFASLNPGYGLALALNDMPAQDGTAIRPGINAMPRTLFDKIWDSHLVGQRADGRDLLYIDRHVLHELHAHHAFTALEKQGRPIHRPDLTFAVQDHTVATKAGRDDNTNPTGTAFLRAMREGTRKNGIRLFDIDDPEQGISHVVAPELGIVLPGSTHGVPDSHASTVGGVGALAFRCRTSEMPH